MVRHKNTRSQALLDADERLGNTKDAFLLANDLPFSHIALLDDVMTTGNTLNEMSKLIKQQTSVKKIDLWLCARAIE